MIIVRSPLRISLGGGGTDLPSYYRSNGGFLISAAINKYIYITIHETFIEEMIIKYSELERVDDIGKIKHPIIREALKLLNIQDLSIEITSMADIPAGTGLGSSGSFTTALLAALHALTKNPVSPEKIAKQACQIEIDILNEPVGKQDQYISSIGGITQFHFNNDDSVNFAPVNISNETLYNLEDNLMLFFTGFSRKASSILHDQDSKTKDNDQKLINNMHHTKELGIKSLELLESGNLIDYGRLMHEHWQYKKQRSKGMSNPQIDEYYDVALKNGAIGGKLVGAGGGGFLLFYTENKLKLRHAMLKTGLREVRFGFDFEGCKVINS